MRCAGKAKLPLSRDVGTRARTALDKILSLFIRKEFGKWAKRFPDAFYQGLFRLKGLKWPPDHGMPQFVGHWTNDLVYNRLAPGLRDDLNTKNPANPRGRRKIKHHQWLTDDIGHPKLKEHIIAINALMRSCDDWDDFHRRLDKAFPKFDLSTLEEQENVIIVDAENKSEENVPSNG